MVLLDALDPEFFQVFLLLIFLVYFNPGACDDGKEDTAECDAKTNVVVDASLLTACVFSYFHALADLLVVEVIIAAVRQALRVSLTVFAERVLGPCSASKQNYQ